MLAQAIGQGMSAENVDRFALVVWIMLIGLAGLGWLNGRNSIKTNHPYRFWITALGVLICVTLGIEETVAGQWYAYLQFAFAAFGLWQMVVVYRKP